MQPPSLSIKSIYFLVQPERDSNLGPMGNAHDCSGLDLLALRVRVDEQSVILSTSISSLHFRPFYFLNLETKSIVPPEIILCMTLLDLMYFSTSTRKR